MSLGIIIPIVIFVGGISVAVFLTNIALTSLHEINKAAALQKKK